MLPFYIVVVACELDVKDMLLRNTFVFPTEAGLYFKGAKFHALGMRSPDFQAI